MAFPIPRFVSQSHFSGFLPLSQGLSRSENRVMGILQQPRWILLLKGFVFALNLIFEPAKIGDSHVPVTTSAYKTLYQ
jgi:hypothetical protein